MRFSVMIERGVERWMPTAAALCTAAAAAIVTLEWLVRQVRDSNLLFAWLEIAAVFGAMAAAFALPATPPRVTPPREVAARRAWADRLSTVVALGITMSFALFVVTGQAELGHSEFFPVFTLREPYAVITVCAAIWSWRCALTAWAPSNAVEVSRPPVEDLAPAYVLLAAGASIIVAASGGFVRAASSLSQTFWGLVAQDDFLTLLLACALVEFVRANFARSESGDALLAGMTADSRSPELAVPGATPLVLLGYVMPTGSLALSLALLLGVTTSEALVAMALPFAVLAAALAPTLLRGVLAAAAPSATAATVRSRLAARVHSASPEFVVVAVAAPVCAAVLLGYARFVEALTVGSTAMVAVAALAKRPSRADLSRLAAVLATRVSFAVVHLLAGACLYTASAIVGLQERVAAAVVGSGAGIIMVAVVGLLLAAALLHRLSALTAALCLLPVLPAALGAAGAEPYQLLVLYCGIIAAAEAGRAFIHGGENGGSRRALFAWASLAAVFALAAFPQVASYMPEHTRLW